MIDDQESKAAEVEQGLLGFLCPRRAGTPSSWPWPAQDVWRVVGPDRVCSFCGSVHPEDLRALLPNVDGDQVHLDIADRRHKIYIRRPEVPNAGAGAIKFYLVHGLPNSDKAFWDLLNEKVKLSDRKMVERTKRIREKMHDRETD